MKDLFSKVFRGGLVVAEAVVEEKLRESGLNSQEVVYTACFCEATTEMETSI